MMGCFTLDQYLRRRGFHKKEVDEVRAKP